MKNISKFILSVCLSSSVFMTGCIEETLPTQIATDDQLASSAKATEALLWAMPAYFNTYQILPSRQDYDRYSQVQHIVST